MNTHSLHRWLLLIALLLAPCSLLLGQTSPYVIPFQGRLTNQQGVSYSSGQYTIVFNIYDLAIGGSTQWTERHEKVGVTNGMISVFLGSITTLPTSTGNPPVAFFSTTRYLGITVDADDNAATADPEMVPRQMIIPAFHAKNADKMSSTFGNYDWSVVFGGIDPGANGTIIPLAKIPVLSVDKLPNNIPATKLETGAALANLNSSGVSGVTTGGVVLSANANDTGLASAGYSKLGVGQFGEGWRQMANATVPAGGGGTNPYAVGLPVYCWTGSSRNEFISWGGSISTSDTTNVGARFNLTTGVWTPMSTVNAPAKRMVAFHAWTGTELVLWGGNDGPTQRADGKYYTPATDTWTDLPALGGVTLGGRNNPGNLSIWIDSPTLTALFIFGGYDGSVPISKGDGALLRKSGGAWSWSQINPTNAPGPRFGYCAVWTGTKVIVWGGYNQSAGAPLNDGRLYDPFTNTWSATAMSSVNAPTGRSGASCCWTGIEMIVWGGYVDSGTNAGTNTGAAYNPTTDQWRTLPSAGLGARYGACSAWTGSDFIVWGGSVLSAGVYNVSDDGARYSPSTDSWTKLPSPGRPGVMEGASAWTGSELLLFGGDRQVAGSWRNDLWSYTPPRTLYLYQRN
ncbi:MAG: Kelch repeat-containing protein [Roseimicrobium sp.]